MGAMCNLRYSGHVETKGSWLSSVLLLPETMGLSVGTSMKLRQFPTGREVEV